MRIFNKCRRYPLVCYPITSVTPQNITRNAQAIPVRPQGKTEYTGVPSKPKG